MCEAQAFFAAQSKETGNPSQFSFFGMVVPHGHIFSRRDGLKPPVAVVPD